MASNLVTSISTWLVAQEPTDPAVNGATLVRYATAIDVPSTGVPTTGIIDTLLGSTVSNPIAAGTTYTGTWVISDVTLEVDNKNHGTITQRLTRTTTPTNEATLPTKIRMYGKDLNFPFAIQGNTENFLADTWLYITPSAASTCDSMTLTAPSGFTEVRRRVDIEQKGDRTCTMTVLWKKITAVAWASAAPDLIDYDNYGTDDVSNGGGEKIGITRYWFMIQKADLATMRTALLAGTGGAAPAAGYIIMDVTIRDDQNGGLTAIQRVIKQVENVDIAGVLKSDPLGLQPVTVDVIETIYDDFTAAGLTAATSGESTPSLYTSDGYTTDLKGNGLYVRKYRYLKGTYPNTTPTGYQYGEDGPNSLRGKDDSVLKLYPGIDVDNMATQVASLKTTAGTSDVSASIGPNGDATIRTTVSTTNTDVTNTVITDATATGSILLEVGKNTSSLYTYLHRAWFAVTRANADILMKAGGNAVGSATYDSITFLHNRAWRVDRRDGLCDVHQQCATNNIDDTGGLFSGKRGPTRYLVGEIKIAHQSVVLYGGTYYLRLEGVLTTTTEASAVKFLNNTSPYAVTAPAGITNLDPQNSRKHGYIKTEDGQTFEAHRVLWVTNTQVFIANADITEA